MIYIDPPYNTGKDFVYTDKFKISGEESEEEEGAVSAEGKRLIKNEKSSNRFHARWLDMMYPRLRLAKDFLREDGVIFISIDDNEVANLRVALDEIFGNENFLGEIAVISNLKGRSDDKHYATSHNYLVVYKKNDFLSLGLPMPDFYSRNYNEVDSFGKRFRLQGLRKRGDSSLREDRPAMHYPFFVNPKTFEVSVSKSDEFSVEVLPYLSTGEAGRRRWGKETAAERTIELCGKEVGELKRMDVFQKDFADGADSPSSLSDLALAFIRTSDHAPTWQPSSSTSITIPHCYFRPICGTGFPRATWFTSSWMRSMPST